MPVTILSKTMKYLGIKGGERSVHWKLEDIDEGNWRYKYMERCPIFIIGIINIVKMSIVPKVIYRSNAIPIQISMAIFTEKEKQP